MSKYEEYLKASKDAQDKFVVFDDSVFVDKNGDLVFRHNRIQKSNLPNFVKWIKENFE